MLGDWGLPRWYTLLLIFVRVLALFSVAPVFGSRNVPGPLKAGLSALLAVILITAQAPAPVAIPDLLTVFAHVVRELLIGLTLGYVGVVLFGAIQLAGQVLDTQMGFSMVNVLDPQTQSPIPLIGNFYYLLALLTFLMINGHHTMISALVESVRSVPIGVAVDWGFAADMVDLFADAFIIGIRISAPTLAATILTDAALAVLSRTVPQLQVFFLGAPLKIAIGTVVILTSLPLYLYLLGDLFSRMGPDLAYFLDAIGGR